LLPLKFGPDPFPSNSFPILATESLEIFLYELFLRTAGGLLSVSAYRALSLLLKRRYPVPRREQSRYGTLVDFSIFAARSKILSARNERLRLRRYDPLADTMKAGCGPSHSAFQFVMEADLVLAARAVLSRDQNTDWYPCTLIYSPGPGITVVCSG
jgi:hypothetical protein